MPCWSTRETEKTFVPLNNIRPDSQAQVEIFDSPLSEFGVLGFDYGYSWPIRRH